ncbi:MAG: hypothetical protein IE916_07025 [Epsilonproteobacteria bacterium]|nr:hypothetical protein [Campylobacterota bacterium]
MKILIYIDNLERLAFYERIMHTLQDEKEFVVLTNRLSVAIRLFRKVKCYLLTNRAYSHAKPITNLKETLSVACGYHTLERAQNIHNSLIKKMQEILIQERLERIFIFNGTTTIGKSLGDFCKKKGIKTTFIEISNLPNRLFIDPEGTNARSYLYRHPEILDAKSVSDEEFEAWRAEYLAKKTLPPQAKNKTTIRYLMVLDYIGFCFGLVREDYRSVWRVIGNKLKNKRAQTFSHANLDEEYIFFPLQVSNDSQIILNSDIDNIEAIELIKREYSHARIYIKPHPAEENAEFIKEVQKLCDERTFIVGNPTQELVSHAKLVVTINSTVGLEAMITGKEVRILGRAIYGAFNRERLKSYICRYLVRIDYFGGEVAKKEAMRLYE